MDPHAPHEYDLDVRELGKRLAWAGILLVALTFVGVLGYRIIDPSAGWVNAFYMTAITLTTVGFGEIIDLTNNPAGRLFTAVLILVGMGGVLYFVSTATAFVLEGQLGHVFWRRRMEREAARLREHVIVCGSGSTALYTATELRAVARPIVMVTLDPERLTGLARELPGVPIVVGDPTDDDTLAAAGVAHAAGVVACTDNDRENIMVTLSVRQLNPTVRIVAMVSDIEHVPKLNKVGADAVVSPNYIGGLRLASELIRPTVVTFLDMMLRDTEANRRIEEIAMPSASRSVGRPLADLELDRFGDALLLAVRTAADEWIYNPPRARGVEDGDVLIFMGSPGELGRICDHLEGVMVPKPVPDGI